MQVFLPLAHQGGLLHIDARRDIPGWLGLDGAPTVVQRVEQEVFRRDVPRLKSGRCRSSRSIKGPLAVCGRVVNLPGRFVSSCNGRDELRDRFGGNPRGTEADVDLVGGDVLWNDALEQLGRCVESWVDLGRRLRLSQLHPDIP
jgi:hypothetical protein